MLVVCQFRYFGNVIHRGYKKCLKFSRYLSGIKPRDIAGKITRIVFKTCMAIGGKMLVCLKIFCTLLGGITLQKMIGVKKKNLSDTDIIDETQ